MNKRSNKSQPANQTNGASSSTRFDGTEVDSQMNGSAASLVDAARQFAATADGPESIIARGLKKSYGGRAVVNGVDIEVRRGEVVGLLGPNGAGKTTSFYMIMGLVRADSGQVKLGSRDITHWPMHRRARAGIGYLAQDPSVFRQLSVEDNVRAVLELMPISASRRAERLEELLLDLELTERRRSRGMALSGGERRRTEIARTLATDPAFILLDEPFTGVDPIVRRDIQRIIIKLKYRGIGILITDHNERDTLDIVDRGYIVSDGQILTRGTAAELLQDEQARAVYFGERFDHPLNTNDRH
ncbi:MAG TPA: LPS export ABC transporter ATP-binding protein [Abditibacteriaceae bacterium]|jgi:lipopolysaccharide export system ATP-binding protein|nr:LPS export ABC transporter ATP-binding protein [Abditibacteriaceae bacterium]